MVDIIPDHRSCIGIRGIYQELDRNQGLSSHVPCKIKGDDHDRMGLSVFEEHIDLFFFANEGEKLEKFTAFEGFHKLAGKGRMGVIDYPDFDRLNFHLQGITEHDQLQNGHQEKNQ